MADNLQGGKGRIVSARGGEEVTPSDDADLSRLTRGILVGEAGALKVTLQNGDTITFPTLVAGIIHPIAASRIWSTGTDATGIIALW